MKHYTQPLFLVSLLLPLTGFGQSYEWVDRIQGAGGQSTTEVSDVSASEYGLYSIGIVTCSSDCESVLSKLRPEDGKRIWRRQVRLDPYTLVHGLTVNARGVYVSGYTRVGGFVRHYSHEGDVVWTLRQPAGVRNHGIASDTHGLYVIEKSEGDTSAVLRQLDFDGNETWARMLPTDIAEYRDPVVGDGQLFVAVQPFGFAVYQPSGDFVRQFDLGGDGARWYGTNDVIYDDDHLYFSEIGQLTKVRVDGVVAWTVPFAWNLNGLADPGGLAVDDDGLFVLAHTARPDPSEISRGSGGALVRMDLDGSITEVTEFPGQSAWAGRIARLNGNSYVAGRNIYFGFGFIGRLSDKVLIPRSLQVLAGHIPGMPPRLAVLDHDLGIGPVRVGIQDATGSDETYFQFSEHLKPVSFDKVADLNGNGYEELVVVSRLPAVAEVRDSLDGSLVSTIELGNRFDPATATVAQPAGESPRLAVVVRNEHAGRTLLREYDLGSGELLASIPYNPNYRPIDVLALPEAGGGIAYAVLARDPAEGAPHKVEIRSAGAGLVDNVWIEPAKSPYELASLPNGNEFAVLRYDSGAERPSVLQVAPDTGASTTVRFVFERYRPVSLLVVPDTDNNGHSQLAVLGEHMHFKNNKVRVEMRDAATGIMNYRIDLDPDLRPSDAAYVGAIPGYSDSALAFAMRLGTEPWTDIVIVDAATGSELYKIALNSYVD